MAEYKKLGTGSATWAWNQAAITTSTGTGAVYIDGTQTGTIGQVWHNWTATATTSTTYPVDNEVWRVWYRNDWVRQETEDEVQQRRDEAQQRRERAARRTLELAQQREHLERGHERGLELLRELLTEEQRNEMDRYEVVTVRGSEGGLYRIQTHARSVHGNITSTDEHGCLLGRLCVAPRMRDDEGRTLPLSDGWVGQLLAIRHNEKELLAKANWSGVRPCAQAQAA